jgi:hypothetical protein
MYCRPHPRESRSGSHCKCLTSPPLRTRTPSTSPLYTAGPTPAAPAPGHIVHVRRHHLLVPVLPVLLPYVVLQAPHCETFVSHNGGEQPEKRGKQLRTSSKQLDKNEPAPDKNETAPDKTEQLKTRSQHLKQKKRRQEQKEKAQDEQIAQDKKETAQDKKETDHGKKETRPKTRAKQLRQHKHCINGLRD